MGRREPLSYRRGISALAGAEVLRLQAQYDSALSGAQTALKVFQAQVRLDYEGRAQHLIGFLYDMRGHHAEALTHYERALHIRERLGD